MSAATAGPASARRASITGTCRRSRIRSAFAAAACERGAAALNCSSASASRLASASARPSSNLACTSPPAAARTSNWRAADPVACIAACSEGTASCKGAMRVSSSHCRYKARDGLFTRNWLIQRRAAAGFGALLQPSISHQARPAAASVSPCTCARANQFSASARFKLTPMPCKYSSPKSQAALACWGDARPGAGDGANARARSLEISSACSEFAGLCSGAASVPLMPGARGTLSGAIKIAGWSSVAPVLA